MRRIIVAAMTILAASGPALAQPRAVIELFTSQGCSSCPPADRMMTRWAQDPNLVALSLPVDYWDYLGWKDTLASRVSTERQYAYAKTFGSAQVYTPQAVINGRSDTKGSNIDAVQTALGSLDRSGKGLTVDVSIRDKGGSYIVEAQVSRTDGTLVQVQESNYGFGPEATRANGDQPLPLSALVTMAEDPAYSF